MKTQKKMLRFLLVGLQSLLVSAASGDDEAVVEDEASDIPSGFPGGKMPTAQELLAMLDSMTGMPDEEKEALRRDLLKQVAGAGGEAAKNIVEDEEGVTHLFTSVFASQFFVLIALLSLITLIFGNFEF